MKNAYKYEIDYFFPSKSFVKLLKYFPCFYYLNLFVGKAHIVNLKKTLCTLKYTVTLIFLFNLKVLKENSKA